MPNDVMGQSIFETSPAIPDLDDCAFFHSMDLPRSRHVRGQWDLRGRFAEYTGGIRVGGRTLLDVGAASGFLSFEAEQRGARVVSVELDRAASIELLPYARHRQLDQRLDTYSAQEAFLTAVKNSYWRAHAELQSANRVFYGNAYALPEELGSFDVVVAGQIFVHLRDVIRALSSIASRCAGTMVIAEGMILRDPAESRLLCTAQSTGADYAFWHHSVGLYREVMGMLGFELVRRSTAKYRCNAMDTPEGVEITTLVFVRVSD